MNFTRYQRKVAAQGQPQYQPYTYSPHYPKKPPKPRATWTTEFFNILSGAAKGIGGQLEKTKLLDDDRKANELYAQTAKSYRDLQSNLRDNTDYTDHANQYNDWMSLQKETAAELLGDGQAYRLFINKISMQEERWYDGINDAAEVSIDFHSRSTMLGAAIDFAEEGDFKGALDRLEDGILAEHWDREFVKTFMEKQQRAYNIETAEQMITPMLPNDAEEFLYKRYENDVKDKEGNVLHEKGEFVNFSNDLDFKDRIAMAETQRQIFNANQLQKDKQHVRNQDALENTLYDILLNNYWVGDPDPSVPRMSVAAAKRQAMDIHNNGDVRNPDLGTLDGDRTKRIIDMITAAEPPPGGRPKIEDNPADLADYVIWALTLSNPNAQFSEQVVATNGMKDLIMYYKEPALGIKWIREGMDNMMNGTAVQSAIAKIDAMVKDDEITNVQAADMKARMMRDGWNNLWDTEFFQLEEGAPSEEALMGYVDGLLKTSIQDEISGWFATQKRTALWKSKGTGAITFTGDGKVYVSKKGTLSNTENILHLINRGKVTGYETTTREEFAEEFNVGARDWFRQYMNGKYGAEGVEWGFVSVNDDQGIIQERGALQFYRVNIGDQPTQHMYLDVLDTGTPEGKYILPLTEEEFYERHGDVWSENPEEKIGEAIILYGKSYVFIGGRQRYIAAAKLQELGVLQGNKDDGFFITVSGVEYPLYDRRTR